MAKSSFSTAAAWERIFCEQRKALPRTVSNNILHEITFLKEKYGVRLTYNQSNVEIRDSKVTQSARPCNFLVCPRISVPPVDVLITEGEGGCNVTWSGGSGKCVTLPWGCTHTMRPLYSALKKLKYFSTPKCYLRGTLSELEQWWNSTTDLFTDWFSFEAQTFTNLPK